MNELFSQISIYIQSHWIELIGTLIGFIYLYFEYKASIYLWIASLAMTLIYVYIYADAGLYGLMGINIYYILLAIYGWVIWGFSKKKKQDKQQTKTSDTPQKSGIRHTPLKWIPLFIGLALVFGILLYFILVHFTDSTVPVLDSITTSLSIIAMMLLAHKYVEQWLLWLVVNIISVYLYCVSGLYSTAVLYSVYALAAIAGYYKWLRLMKQDNNPSSK